MSSSWSSALQQLEDWTARQEARLVAADYDGLDEASPVLSPHLPSRPPAVLADRAAQVLGDLVRLQESLATARDATARQLQMQRRLTSAVGNVGTSGAVYVDGYG